MTREELLRKRIILVGYSNTFYSKYCHELNFICGLTGSKATEMTSEDGTCSLEYIHYSRVKSFHFEPDMCFILCLNDENWSQAKDFEAIGAREHEGWILREYAEAILDDKKICLLAGVCTVQRFGDVLSAIPDFASKYLISAVQVNFCRNIKGGTARFRHLADLAGVFIYCNLGKEYSAFYPENFNLPSDCRIYKIPFIGVNFLYPQMGKRIVPIHNPYILHANRINDKYKKHVLLNGLMKMLSIVLIKDFLQLKLLSFVRMRIDTRKIK